MKAATIVLMFAMALALFPATPVAAHGVQTAVAVGPTTVATFTHADGSPMAGVPFTVTAPAGAAAFLTGNTDVHGRVVFLPDRVGAWKVRVAGVDGHGAVVTIDIDSTAVGLELPPAAVHTHEHPPVDEPATAPGHDHDHELAGDHEHDHDHAADAAAPVKAGANSRLVGVASGIAVLIVVFGLVFILLRLRAR